jgi:hypothetical protein
MNVQQRKGYKMELGYKDCQRPHNAPHATGIDKGMDWVEVVQYVAIAIGFIAVTAVSKGWL